MRARLHLLSIVVLATAAFGAGAVTPPPAEDIAFVGAHVIPMTGPWTHDDHTVIVRDGVIVAVGPSAETPPAPSDRIVEAAGLVLMPGLAEMHAHVPPPRQPNLPETYQQDVLTLWVANGITLARGMLGQPQHLELRSALAANEVLGPRLVTSGPSFNGRSVRSPRQARERVAAQAAAGYDFLKMHPGLERDEFDAIAEAARAADIPFAGHVSVDVGLEHTLAGGQLTIDHLDGYMPLLVPDPEDLEAGADAFFGIGLGDRVDRSRIAGLVTLTKDAGAWVVPTETLMENIAGARLDLEAVLDRPENAWLPQGLYEQYRRSVIETAAEDFDAEAFLAVRKALIGALHRGGVPVLLGSDSPQIMNVPGFSIHRELEAMVAAGLHPMEAIATGTTNPARFLDEEGRHGVITPGAEASFVLLRANPIVDIAHTREIEGVMVRGRWLDRGFLDDRLTEIRERYARP